ncbi:MAG: S8 family peptidase [Bacteroidetes bacterium]|nr:S8 family peptidase [Bacteroidota bacterium]
MKYFLPLLLVLLGTFVRANNFETYTQNIAADRLLLIFNSNISQAEKDELIKASGLVTATTHLPNPKLTICFVSNYNAAANYFASKDAVSFVSFFITDGQHHAGVTNQFFVKLRDKNFEPQMKELMKAHNISQVKADKYVPNLYLLTVSGKTDNVVNLSAQFSNAAWCQYAAPNYLLNPLVNSNDAYYNRQWALSNEGTALQGNGTVDADMDVDSAWTITTGSSTIKVAIIDSGVDTLHNDLRANLLPGHDAVGDSTDGYPTPNFQEDGHGTCCAGIIGAIKDNSIGIAGVAPSCKLIPVRSFYYTNNGGNILPFSTAAIFADAIGWAWNDAEADLMSQSWGLPQNLIVLLPGGVQPVEDAMLQAYQNGRGGKGCAMFFSSGNEGGSAGPIWPGKLDIAIAVNATSMCDERKNENDCSNESWGGDYGPGLDFSAPGVRVPTTDMRGNKGFSTTSDYYMLFNGTSAACPNAAGVGALVLSLRGDLSAEDLRNVIAQTADKVGGYAYDSTYSNGTWSHELGFGRVNAYSAVQFATIYSSIGNVNTNIEWNMYPNPAHNIVTIQTAATAGQVKVYNMAGQQVLATQLVGSHTRLDVSLLQSGVYMVELATNEGKAVRKLSLAK